MKALRILPLLLPLSLVFCVFLPAHSALANEGDSTWLDIEVGKSVVLETPHTPTAIAITDPAVANIIPLGIANRIQVQGTSVGTTDLVVQFSRATPPIIYEITVHRDLSALIRQIDIIVEGEVPQVYPLGERIVVEGTVSDLDTLERVAQVAQIYDPNFVNLMIVRGDHQVQLEVVFAEVSRTATKAMGLNLLYNDGNLGFSLLGANSSPTPLQLIPGSSAAEALVETIAEGLPGAAAGAFTVGALSSALNIAGVLSVLDDYAMGKILAQPTLVCLSGQSAEFLAGGEIPLPQSQGMGQTSIEFKEYGVKLAFVPTVLAGDVIDVRMEVEVSEPDYGKTIRLTGTEIPGFVTRKGRSHLRLGSGMTFAMAGMLSENRAFSRIQIPGLGSIPLIGALFRGIRYQRTETELVIFVTPRLVRPLGPGEIPALPGAAENNNPNDLELFLFGIDHRFGSRTAEPTGAVGLQR